MIDPNPEIAVGVRRRYAEIVKKFASIATDKSKVIQVIDLS